MSHSVTTEKLKKLRDVMKNSSFVRNALQAFIIPTEDNHQSEYIATCYKRRAYVSGFTGSAGTAIVTENKAAIWVDGRYELQASQEIDDNWILMKQMSPSTPTQSQWLCDVLSSGSKIGFDPYLMSFDKWKSMSKELRSSQLSLVPVEKNLIDIIWDDQPESSKCSVECLPIEFSGMHWLEKIEAVRTEMKNKKAHTLVITMLDEIAWLFNLRGSDIDYNPVFYSYAIVTLESVFLFIDLDKLPSTVESDLKKDIDLKIYPYESVCDVFKQIVEEEKGKFWISSFSSYALVSIIPENLRLINTTPIATKKAIKNAKEIEGAQKAHIKDAVALCEFFAWLEEAVPQGNVTEISAAEYLNNLRKSQINCVGSSFETISAFGSNASVIHYRSSPETNKIITKDNVYLVDSGGQYRDGTTDVTRTVHYGTPTDFQKKCYTLVLKGFIALSTLVFPKFTVGSRIDSFARQFLWKEGLDYKHGTGHGVGAFLNVHEGPMSINLLINPSDPGLQPDMILSIEPGYYEDNNFGLRIENLAFLKVANTLKKCNGLDYLEFEQLTLVPLEQKLIDSSLLTQEEIQWVNNYHSLCREVIGDALKKVDKVQAYNWLMNVTGPL